MPVVPPLTPVVWMAALVMGVAGVGKLARPGATAAALGRAGLPSAPWAARLLGVTEVAVGAAVLTLGGSLAPAAMAGLYAAFTIYGVRQLRADGQRACGCFGGDDAPLTRIHVAVDLGATAVGATAAAAATPGLGALRDDPVAGVLVVALVVLGAGMMRLLLTSLPSLLALATIRGEPS